MDRTIFEEIVIGSCLVRPDTIEHFKEIKPQYFSYEPLSALWRILLDKKSSGETIYPPTLAQEFGKTLPAQETENATKQAGQIMASLMGHAVAPNRKDCEYYCQEMKKAYINREAKNILNHYSNILSERAEFETEIPNIQQAFLELSVGTKTAVGVEHIGDIALRSINRLNERLNGNTEKPIQTGFPTIDKAMGGGVHKGGLTMIGGSTGMGKTIMGLTLAWSMVLNGGRCLYFNLEMSAEDMVDRILSNHTNVSSVKMRDGSMTDIEFEKVYTAVEEMKQRSFLIDSRVGISIDDIIMGIREQSARGGLDIVVIDYIQIVKTLVKKERRDQELSQMAIDLSNLAKELKLTIVILAQLNDDMGKRENNRPTMSDVRESKSIAHSCENVWILFREEYYADKKKPSEDDMDKFMKWSENMEKIKGKGEVIIAKNRHGYTTTVDVDFEGAYMRYREY